VWVDSDVSIVDKGMDPLTLLPSNKELVFSSDKFGICTGVFGAKKSQWTLGVFKAVVLLGQTDRERSKEFDLFDYRAEQFVFRALLRYFPDVRAHCHVFDESVVQNRMSNYAPKAWMFHFWMGGRSASEILRKKQALSENEWSCEAFWEAGRYDLQTSKDIAHVAKKIGIEAKRLAFLVGLSEDFEKSPIRSLGLDESDRLIRISNLGDEAFQLFGDAMIARQWLSTQLPSLNDNEPIDLCVSATGYDQAIDALEKTTRKGPRKDALKGS